MKRKFLFVTLITFSIFGTILAQSSVNDLTAVYENEAFLAATNWLEYINNAPLQGKLGYYRIKKVEAVNYKGFPICYVYNFSPKGHLVLSGYRELSPIRSFSFRYEFNSFTEGYEELVIDELKNEVETLIKGTKKNAYLFSTVEQNKEYWRFWEKMGTEQEFSKKRFIKKRIGETYKKLPFQYAKDIPPKTTIKRGKLFDSYLPPEKKRQRIEKYEFFNNKKVAKYFQHLHRNLHKKRQEAEYKNKEKIKTKNADIILLSNTVYSQTDVDGDIVLTGAVKNNGTSPSVYTKITVSFFDKNDNLIENFSTFIDGGTNIKTGSGKYTNALFPGEKGFFLLWTSLNDAPIVDHYDCRFGGWNAFSSLCNAEIEFDGTPSFFDFDGDLHISGNMKNTCDNYVSYYTGVHFAIYNSDGKVIDVDSTWVDGDIYDTGYGTTDSAIYPGQTWPFDLLLIFASYDDFSTYEYSFTWDETPTNGGDTYNISGKVSKSTGGGLNGVTMNGLPGNPTTNDSGQYSAKVDEGWSGMVEPSKEHYEFWPPFRAYSNVNIDQLNQNYMGTLIQYTLTIRAEMGGTTDPSPRSYTYNSGAEVTIKALPNNNYRFTNWSGDVSGSNNPITITMDSDKSIKANFIRQYDLTITTEEGGTTEPSPGTHTYDKGTEVTVTAIPDDHYIFNGWSGDISSQENPVTLTMNSDKSIKANFNIISPPAAFSGEKVLNRSLSQAEYINVLEWEANPQNEGINIANYRIYQVENNELNLLKEVSADTFEYLHRDVDETKEYKYAITAVTEGGKEGVAAYASVK